MRTGIHAKNCQECKYLTGKRCKLWEVRVTDPKEQYCETGETKDADITVEENVTIQGEVSK